MKKIIISHYFKDNYTVSYSVLLNFKLFYIMEDYFYLNNYEILSLKDFIVNKEDKELINNKDKNYELDDEVFEKLSIDAQKNLINIIKDDDTYQNAYIIGFHPKGYMWFFRSYAYEYLKKRNIKIIIWQDDLHCYPKTRKLDYNEIVLDNSLNKMDLLLTPSVHYWKNINHPLLTKTKYYFYCFNENFYNELPINNYNERKTKILLSGANYQGYPIRQALLRYYNKNKDNNQEEDNLAKYIDFYPHPTYDRHKNKGKTGLDYYKEISTYKAAFFGFYNYPLNYPLAKIIEILACGTLGFLEDSPVIQEYLGLEKFKHYVPILLNEKNEPILDASYYLSFLTTPVGKKIAEDGCKYVRNKFTMKNKCDELIKILNNIEKE